VIVQAQRMITSALRNGGYGVNAQLLALSTDPSDSTTPVATMDDETQNLAVALNRSSGLTLPALVVTLDGDFTITAYTQNNYREAEIPFLIRYVVKDAEADKAQTNTYYTIQALEHCLAAWQLNQNAADRTHNNVQVISTTGMLHSKNWETIEDAFVTGGLRLTLLVRDITT
jgi:hypothetical protein